MKENRIFSQINFLPDQMFLAFMSWIWMNIPMNDISWKWKGELLLLTTNSLIQCDRHTDLWHMQPVKKCPVCAASSGGWRLSWRIRDPGPRPPGVVRSGHQHHRCDTASLAGESLSPATLRHCRYSPHSLTLRGQSQSARLCPQTGASDQISVLCFFITSVCCGNSKLMCCFVLRDPLMTLLYQLMKEEVMEI